MKHRIPTTVILIFLTLAVCVISLMFTRVANMQGSGNTTTAKSGGLLVVTFTLPSGRVNVSLPDDMAAGDTISGTVVAEPSGKTDQEKQRNADTLRGFVIEFEHQKLPVSDATIRRIALSPGVASPTLILLDGKGKQVGVVTVPVAATPTSPSTIPSSGVGQAGRPLAVHGPFDGDSSNTTVKIGNSDAKLLAESPRKVVIESPRDVVGPTAIEVKENNSTTTGQFRNLKIDLTAPKTSLLKGESTELHVQVTGLEGLTQPVNVQLQNQSPSTVQLSGGDTQTQTVRPQDVQTGGVYTWNGNVTGVQSGSFFIVATVPSGIYFQEGPLPGPNDPLQPQDPTKTEPAKDPRRRDPLPFDPRPDPERNGPGQGDNPNLPRNPGGGGGGNSGNNPQTTDCHCDALTVTAPLKNKHAVSIADDPKVAGINKEPVSMVLKVKAVFDYDMVCKGKFATHCYETITWKPTAKVLFKDWNHTLVIEGEQKTLSLDGRCEGSIAKAGCHLNGHYDAMTTLMKEVTYPPAYIAMLKKSGIGVSVKVGTIDVEITWQISAEPACGSLGNLTTRGEKDGGKYKKGDGGLFEVVK